MLTDKTRLLIVQSVDDAIHNLFPKKYFSLCHAYAVVGASVASIILDRRYRPVAGLAVIDCGAGHHLKLLDDKAFSCSKGGAYHCWIESVSQDGADKEIIDIGFKNNRLYAKKHKIPWLKKDSSYLWGKYREVVIDAELKDLPPIFPEGKLWLRETPEGAAWMNQHLDAHINEYAKITAHVLRTIKHDMEATA